MEDTLDNGASTTNRLVILTLPAYNEAENLRPLVEHAHQLFREASLSGIVVVVDDGSTDETPVVLEELRSIYGVHVLTHPQNRGLGRAIMTGLRGAVDLSQSPDDVIICMDADNTHSPAYIPAMTREVWQNGCDIVIASRFQPGSEEVGVPPFRLLLSRTARFVFQAILRLPGVRDYTCGFRAYRVSLIQKPLKNMATD